MQKRRPAIFGSLGILILVAFAASAQQTVRAFTRDILQAHNAVRQRTGVPPLKWSGKLAARAEEWAKTLAATGASKMQGIPGQNIAYTSPPGRIKAASIVAAWAAEAANYDHAKNACIDPKLRCNHYTQLVWRNSSYLGCGTARDAERDIWVCDYDPPGNVAERPY